MKRLLLILIFFSFVFPCYSTSLFDLLQRPAVLKERIEKACDIGYLDLSNLGLTDVDGFGEIVGCFKDRGVIVVAVSFANNPHLQYLPEELSTMPDLKYLNILGTCIDAHACEEMTGLEGIAYDKPEEAMVRAIRSVCEENLAMAGRALFKAALGGGPLPVVDLGLTGAAMRIFGGE